MVTLSIVTVSQTHRISQVERGPSWIIISQLLPLQRTNQKSDTVSENMVQALLELCQLKALNTALWSLFHAHCPLLKNPFPNTHLTLPWHLSMSCPQVLGLMHPRIWLALLAVKVLCWLIFKLLLTRTQGCSPASSPLLYTYSQSSPTIGAECSTHSWYIFMCVYIYIWETHWNKVLFRSCW